MKSIRQEINENIHDFSNDIAITTDNLQIHNDKLPVGTLSSEPYGPVKISKVEIF